MGIPRIPPPQSYLSEIRSIGTTPFPSYFASQNVILCKYLFFHSRSQIVFQLLLKVEIWTHFYKLHMIFQNWNRRPCGSTKKNTCDGNAARPLCHFGADLHPAFQIQLKSRASSLITPNPQNHWPWNKQRAKKNTKSVLLLDNCVLQCQDLTLGFEVYSMIGSPSLHPTVRSSKDAALTDSCKSMRAPLPEVKALTGSC